MNKVGSLFELLTMIGTQEYQLDTTWVSVDLVGEFDTYELEPLCDVLDGLLGLKETAYVNLSRVTFLDLRCARELAIRSHLCGGRLGLHNPSWQAVSSFRACGYGRGSLLPHPMTTTPRIQPSEVEDRHS